jgi:hypothetical protein
MNDWSSQPRSRIKLQIWKEGIGTMSLVKSLELLILQRIVSDKLGENGGGVHSEDKRMQGQDSTSDIPLYSLYVETIVSYFVKDYCVTNIF